MTFDPHQKAPIRHAFLESSYWEGYLCGRYKRGSDEDPELERLRMEAHRRGLMRLQDALETSWGKGHADGSRDRLIAMTGVSDGD